MAYLGQFRNGHLKTFNIPWRSPFDRTHKLPKELGSQETRINQESLKIDCRESLVPSPPSRRKTLVIAEKKLRRNSIKDFGPFYFSLIFLLCPIKFLRQCRFAGALTCLGTWCGCVVLCLITHLHSARFLEFV